MNTNFSFQRPPMMNSAAVHPSQFMGQLTPEQLARAMDLFRRGLTQRRMGSTTPADFALQNYLQQLGIAMPGGPQQMQPLQTPRLTTPSSNAARLRNGRLGQLPAKAIGLGDDPLTSMAMIRPPQTMYALDAPSGQAGQQPGVAPRPTGRPNFSSGGAYLRGGGLQRPPHENVPGLPYLRRPSYQAPRYPMVPY